MKQNIHPPYRVVIFQDAMTGKQFRLGSTIQTERTTVYQDQDYPLVMIETSSDSHPFYTGKQKFTQQEGRIAQFNRRYQKKD